MRVTDRMLYDRARIDGGSARERLDEATARVSTGLRVTRPGDDPAAAGLVTLERQRQARFDALATTAGRASNELGAADGALDTVAGALARARELAVQLSNPNYSSSDRVAGANEVKGLISSIAGALNAKAGNRYVFSGTQDGVQPFDGLVLDAAGNVDRTATGAYHGDALVRQVEIAPGVLQDASLRADVAVKGAGGGTDVFAVLADLANALTANDPAAVAATLTGLTQGTGQVATARGAAGAAMSILDAAVTAGQAARDDAKTRVSDLSEVDLVTSSTELALAEHALDAALTATAQTFKLSLLDKT